MSKQCPDCQRLLKTMLAAGAAKDLSKLKTIDGHLEGSLCQKVKEQEPEEWGWESAKIIPLTPRGDRPRAPKIPGKPHRPPEKLIKKPLPPRRHFVLRHPSLTLFLFFAAIVLCCCGLPTVFGYL